MTPMMRQYMEAKQAHPDAMLLFRMGDFYELFHDDAKEAARILNLALTSRDKGENATPMAGFPHHQLETYLAKLIAAGKRVAVCDQVEDPKQAKGLVRREITRVVTAGTVTDEAILDPKEPNYLVALSDDEPVGLAWIDLSTGRFFAGTFATDRVWDHITRLAPSECLISSEAPPLSEQQTAGMLITRRPAWAFSYPTAIENLTKHFGAKGLEGFGFDESGPDRGAVRAAGAILDYLYETQKTSLEHIERLERYQPGVCLEIDESTWRSLEISRTLRQGRREGSLLWVLDRTVTAMGSRQLAEWTAAPLIDVKQIRHRQEAVAELVDDQGRCRDLREALRRVYDIERLLVRITTGRCTPRDLSYLGRTLRMLPDIKAALHDVASPLLQEIDRACEVFPDLRELLDNALEDDCPLAATEGGFIRPGYRSDLDNLRELARGGKEWIANYQAAESERTGIPTLKVGYNKVFGYYIEITNTHRDKVPSTYVRKQTLKNAERYITPELKEYEDKVLTADEQAKQLEYELFVELRNAVLRHRSQLQRTARQIAVLDALASLAELARDRGYCRPEITDEPVLEIIDGRHPVLDLTEPEGTFVPNDAVCSPEDGNVLLITGPNMAGKSTYIRQTALLVLMAQIGSFVPARKAVIGTADRIFARVGASDELARGRSTFMVEMIETARILNLATSKSLVILDEIGRGTSTYDGISLAWAAVEYLHDRIGCRTFFATHYHELTDLERLLPKVKNYNVAVREWADEVVFLHKITPGAADKSYGIHVARLAGVPKPVIERAKDILARLEAEHLDGSGKPNIAKDSAHPAGKPVQLTFFEMLPHPVVEQIRELDIDHLTPVDALKFLADWKDRLEQETKPKSRSRRR
ncbi:DNA mismatch repair protein MutS [Thermostilla marina]